MNAAGERIDEDEEVAAFVSPALGLPIIASAHRHVPQTPSSNNPATSMPPLTAPPCTTTPHTATPVVLAPPTAHFLRSALLHSPLLSTLSVDESDDLTYHLDALINSTHRISLPAGTLLVKQGEVGDEVYIIEQGLVDVVKTRLRQTTPATPSRRSYRKRRRGEEEEGGEESTIVASAGAGDIVGELAIFYSLPRQASLLTRTEVTAYAISRAAFDEFLSAHPHLSSALQHRRWLRMVLKQHYLFAHLDNESEKERLISAFHPRYYRQHDTIISQGETAADFYILQEGECAVSTLNAQTHEPVPVAKVHAGQSFGEVALLYATQRSATVQCLSDGGCTVWSVSGREFLAHCQRGSLFLQHVFFRFAQLQDEVTHERLMTREDFIAAMRFINRHQRPSSSPSSSFSLSFSSAPSSSSTPLSDSRLRLMFRLADVSGDSAISFVEFLHLHILLTHPHSCAELAFRMFDKNCSGRIERDEFVRVVRWLAEDRGEKLELENNRYMQQLFKDGQSLSFEQFAQTMKEDSFPSFLSSIRTDLQAIDSFAATLDTSLPLSAALLSDTTSLISLPPQLQSLDQIDDHLFRMPWRTLLAGGVAGGISRTLVSPLERLKILFQTQGAGMTKYSGLGQGLRQMYAEDGLRGWFRGNGSNVIRIVPAVALQFAFYDLFKRFMFDHPFVPITRGDSEKRKCELGSVQRLVAGASAGISACIITYPLDFVRARLTLQSGPDALYGGIIDAFRQVYRQEGVRGFYHGLWPSVVGIAPYLGLDFAVYEGLKGVVRRLEGEERVTKANLFICGAMAGTAGQIVAYPIDTIRRRMQVQGFGPATYRYAGSIRTTMKQIVREEGVRGLYKGMTANLCKVAPAVSMSFVTYEYMRELLGLEEL